MGETLHLSFSIEGEFITNLARERFYCDHNLSGAIDLVQSATVNDEMSEVEHLMLALEIIAGKKSIVGTYPGDDYGVEENEDKECYFQDFIKEIDNLQVKLSETEKQLNEVTNKYSFVLGELEDYRIRMLNDTYYDYYGEYLFKLSPEEKAYNNLMQRCTGAISDSAEKMLDEFISRKKDVVEHTYEDYGWLEPDGTYHEVEWGMHSQWAREYADEHYPFNEYAHMYWKEDAKGERHHYVCGDFLVYVLGWVLLDSPYQGIATPKYDLARGMTKAQKEFLFDYYIERNLNDRASALYKDEED